MTAPVTFAKDQARVGPLVRVAVRRRMRQELTEPRVNARRLKLAEINARLALLTDEVIDDAASRAGKPTNVAGPFADWLARNQEWLTKLVDILLAVLL